MGNFDKAKVYCAINPSMPNLVKIGCTTYDDIRNRLVTLSNKTCIPTKFICPFYLEVPYLKGTEIEHGIHNLLKSIGATNVGKEFFQCNYENLYHLFKGISLTLEEGEINFVICQILDIDNLDPIHAVANSFCCSEFMMHQYIKSSHNPKGYL